MLFVCVCENFHWTERSLWPLCQTAQISEVLHLCFFFWKFFPQGLWSSDNQIVGKLSYQTPLPQRLSLAGQPVLGSKLSEFKIYGGLCALGNLQRIRFLWAAFLISIAQDSCVSLSSAGIVAANSPLMVLFWSALWNVTFIVRSVCFPILYSQLNWSQVSSSESRYRNNSKTKEKWDTWAKSQVSDFLLLLLNQSQQKTAT